MSMNFLVCSVCVSVAAVCSLCANDGCVFRQIRGSDGHTNRRTNATA